MKKLLKIVLILLLNMQVVVPAENFENMEELEAYGVQVVAKKDEYNTEDLKEIKKIIDDQRVLLPEAIEIFKAEKAKKRMAGAMTLLYTGIGVFYALVGVASPLINTYFSPYIKNLVAKKIFHAGLQPKKTAINFDDIAGYQEIKRKLKTVIKKLKKQKHTKQYEKMDGILFHGDPGNGKTYFAQALANEAGVDMYCIKATDLVNEQGQVENRVDLLFEQINTLVLKHGPCILFLDEVDFILKNREKGNLTQNEQLLLQAFLNKLDGEIALKGVLVICNTNYYDAIDQALLRPGRIGEDIEFTNPTENEIIELINLYAKKFNINCLDDSTIMYLAKRAVGMSVSKIIKFLTDLNDYSKDNNYVELSQALVITFINESNYIK
jgi:ATP-dependent Zn protease